MKVRLNCKEFNRPSKLRSTLDNKTHTYRRSIFLHDLSDKILNLLI